MKLLFVLSLVVCVALAQGFRISRQGYQGGFGGGYQQQGYRPQVYRQPSFRRPVQRVPGIGVYGGFSDDGFDNNSFETHGGVQSVEVYGRPSFGGQRFSRWRK